MCVCVCVTDWLLDRFRAVVEQQNSLAASSASVIRVIKFRSCWQFISYSSTTSTSTSLSGVLHALLL